MREAIAVPDKMLDNRGFITLQRPVGPVAAALDMRCLDCEDVPFILAGGESGPGMLRVGWRVGPPVHPNRPYWSHPLHLCMPCNDLLRLRIDLLPDTQIRKTVLVIGRVWDALMFGKIQQICSPAFRMQASGIVERKTVVLSYFRTISPVQRILVISSGPLSRKIRLRKCPMAG